jgi:ankyrin repeat protein
MNPPDSNIQSSLPGSSGASDPVAAFINAACVPLEHGHTSGTLEQAEEILRTHPTVAAANIHTASILADESLIRNCLTSCPADATAKGGPRNWDALTHLCFSRYLRLDRARSPGFVRCARALLDAGASANTGFFSNEHQPKPEFESALYGAAGVAHDADLTRLLLEHGAEPNDGEVPYHAPEGWDNDALKVLLQSGRMNGDSLATMLLRKTDWHDCEGVRLLIQHGANPNALTGWGKTALHNAALSDNDIEIFEVLLDHGADPTIVGTHPEAGRSAAGATSIAVAARRGRGDVLRLFEQRGMATALDGVDALIAACAKGDAASVEAIARRSPELVNQVREQGGWLLGQFAGNGNTEGVGRLLDLGVGVDSIWIEGDGYFGVARNSTALHVAAWRSRPATVRFLIQRGASINSPDGHGRTPLMLAIRACVDSYWADRRTPESVAALLDAGARTNGITRPSGYSEVDELLRRAGVRYES